MLERALLTALICDALMVLASVASTFNPLSVLAENMGQMSCKGSGWSDQTCSADRT